MMARLMLAFMATFPEVVSAQLGRVEGRVLDVTGNAIVGASVTLLGTNLGAITDQAGDYGIDNVGPGTQTVRAARQGFEPATVSVTVPANATVTVNFVLNVNVLVPAIISADPPGTLLPPSSLKPPVPDSVIIRSRQATAIPLVPNPGGRALLALFPDVVLTIVIESVALSPGGSRAHGSTHDRNGRTGTIVLIQNNGRVSANVRHGLRLYMIRAQELGVHLVVEVDLSRMPTEPQLSLGRATLSGDRPEGSVLVQAMRGRVLAWEASP